MSLRPAVIFREESGVIIVGGEEKTFAGIRVRVVSPMTPWRTKTGTVRPIDGFGAAALAGSVRIRGEVR